MLAKTARGEEIIVKCKSELHALYCTAKDFTPATFYVLTVTFYLELFIYKVNTKWE